METQLVRIVNRGLAGEPEHLCLQNVETTKIYEFSKIVGENISDGDINHETIKRILAEGHVVNISVDENDNVTLHF